MKEQIHLLTSEIINVYPTNHLIPSSFCRTYDDYSPDISEYETVEHIHRELESHDFNKY